MNRRFTTQILTLLLGTVIVVWLLPRHSASTYLYQVNRPWNYQLLTAPFDIPIRPDSLTAQAAIDSINRKFVPVYKRVTSVDDAVRTRFAQALGSVEGVSASTRSLLTSKVRDLYASGIVDEEVFNDISTGRLPAVRVATGRGPGVIGYSLNQITGRRKDRGV
ncbi:MAG: hypothetical protein K2L33_02090, partial [Muribaculaceae bacterium]|nr:hypothetical protein [Muribaculaceae bacterium]